MIFVGFIKHHLLYALKLDQRVATLARTRSTCSPPFNTSGLSFPAHGVLLPLSMKLSHHQSAELARPQAQLWCNHGHEKKKPPGTLRRQAPNTRFHFLLQLQQGLPRRSRCQKSTTKLDLVLIIEGALCLSYSAKAPCPVQKQPATEKRKNPLCGHRRWRGK